MFLVMRRWQQCSDLHSDLFEINGKLQQSGDRQLRCGACHRPVCRGVELTRHSGFSKIKYMGEFPSKWRHHNYDQKELRNRQVTTTTSFLLCMYGMMSNH